MKIALYTYNTKPRGGVVHTLALAEALREKGCSVRVYALGLQGQNDFFRPVRTETKVFPFVSQPNEAFEAKIHRYIDTYTAGLAEEELYTFDIHHAQDCISANVLARLRARGGVNFIFRTVHHLDNFTTPALIECQNRSVLLPDTLVTVSDSWHRILQADFNRTSTVIHNGVDSRFFHNEESKETLKAKYGLQDNVVFLTVGGIEPRKNTINTLRAFVQVKQYKPNAVLLIAGGSTLFDYRYYLEQFEQELNGLDLSIREGVRIAGELDNDTIQDYYRLADCYVQPSIKEGWGLALLEAMASGTPVVASTIEVFREFLQNRHNALLAHPDNVEAIAAQMLLATSDADMGHKLIMNGRSTALRYTWSKAAEKHLRLYESSRTMSRP